ncbi:MAG: four helix bundle protein [Planctomycetes bacterium]|nr:four helix bundle protein [Planctomycetota bacterium]
MTRYDKITSFKDLVIWKRGIDLVEKIYELTKVFPKEEAYGLTSQIRRCSVSVPSNIAEGFSRGHENEYKQFLFISLGSCSELVTQLTIAARLDYIEDKEVSGLIDEVEQISKMTMSLVKKLN